MEALEPKYKLPPKPPPKRQLAISVTDEERKSLEKAAKEAGGTISEYLIHLHKLATKQL